MNRKTSRTALIVLIAGALTAFSVGVSGGATAQAEVAPATRQQDDPKLALLTAQNSTLLLIDFQPQMIFGVHSHDRQLLRNNVEGLTKAAKAFDVPTILTTVAAKSFSGPMISEITGVFPEHTLYDRTSMNTWDDTRVVSEIGKAGRPKLVIAALWTEVCLVMPALEAMDAGYEVYIVTDACGGTSAEAHDMAIERLVQAGAIPVTWQQVMLEWQRDWARVETYDAVNDIVRQHSGAYGIGVGYAHDMFDAKEGQH